MTLKIYKTHRAPDKSLGYTYAELYSLVIKEWGLKPVPTIGKMAREASYIIKNYFVKEGIIDRVVDKKRHIRYTPSSTRAVTKPINVGTDVSTGYNMYQLPDEKRFATIDETWNIQPEPKARYVRITISTTFSLDTGGGNQRLKFYEATAFVTLPYSEGLDANSVGGDLRDSIREALSYYFNPEVAEASEIKIGVEIMSSPSEESLGDPTIYIEYGHGGTRAQGYATLKKTVSQMKSEKLQMFEPHEGHGRETKQKELGDFEK